MNLIKVILSALALCILMIACSQPAANTAGDNDGKKMAKVTSSQTPSPASNTTSTNAAAPTGDVAQGAELYKTNCAKCHQDSGKGGKVTVEGKNLDVKDLTSDRMKQRTDEKLTKDITEGAEDDGMPAFKGKLKPDEIAAVVKHVRTLQPK